MQIVKQNRTSYCCAALEARRGDRPPAWATVEAEARTRLTAWRGLLGRHPTEARPVLRQLFDGRRIRFTPLEIGAQRGYRFEGDAGVGGVLEGLVARVTSLGVPTGQLAGDRIQALDEREDRP